jgi:hypothetical protein
VSMRRHPRRAALVAVCAACLAPAAAGATPAPAADLSGVKAYLTDHTRELVAATASLRRSSERYYGLARGTGFDHARLWRTQRAAVSKALLAAKRHWRAANPAYEEMEGIVAGTPRLARYDVILDAGAPASEDPSNAVPFDLRLPNGRVLRRPGNFAYLTETTLYGTRTDFSTGVRADLDRDGRREFGEVLPDANVLVAVARGFHRYAGELASAGRAWTPTASDAFTALVVMTPTMSEYFQAWKTSRFVSGARSTRPDFVSSSRLSDIVDILEGLQVVYRGVRPSIAGVDPARGRQIGQSLETLRAEVADLQSRERRGTRFTPEQADVLGSEAQGRATAIAGDVSQSAARLRIKIEQ